MTRCVLIAFLALVSAAHSARAVDQEEVEVRKVIEEGNKAWVEAAKTLDAAPLQTWMRGQAFAEISEQIAIGRESEIFISFSPPEIEVERISVDSLKAEARVQAFETWKYSVHEVSTGECISRGGPNKTRVIYSLKRVDGRWLIFSTIHEPVGERKQKLPCGAVP